MTIRFRGLAAGDRKLIKRILLATSVFKHHEIRIALEIVDETLTAKSRDYHFVCAEEGGVLAGFGSYGPVSMSIGTYDLYWIAVDPKQQGKGIGRQILERIERKIGKRGRLLMAETSSLPLYEKTRRFYEKTGFEKAAQIADYYDRGDDLVIYKKRLDSE